MDVSCAQRTPTVQEGILELVQIVKAARFLVKERAFVFHVSYTYLTCHY